MFDLTSSLWMATTAYSAFQSYRVLRSSESGALHSRMNIHDNIERRYGMVDDFVALEDQQVDIEQADRFLHYSELDMHPHLDFFRKNKELLNTFKCKTTRDCVEFFKFKLFCVGVSELNASIHIGHANAPPLLTYEKDEYENETTTATTATGKCVPTPVGGNFIDCNPNSSVAKIVVAESSVDKNIVSDIHGDTWNPAEVHVNWYCASKYPNVIKVDGASGAEVEIACGDSGRLVHSDDMSFEWRNNKTAFNFNKAACKCRADDIERSFLSLDLSCPPEGNLNSCHPGVRDPNDSWKCSCPSGYVTCPQLKNFNAEFHELHCYGSYRAHVIGKSANPICVVDPCEPHGRFNEDSGKCYGKDSDKYIYDTTVFHIPVNSFGVVVDRGNVPLFGIGGGKHLWDVYHYTQLG